MAKTRDYDLIVVGGGPAGATLAGLVKKHAPQRKVVLLERAAGPRHHVGESLLPGMVPVLKELGVFEKIDAAGFPRKIGANYVWGKNRKVWENDFNDSNVSDMLARRGGLPERLEYAWQVRRSRYDAILLDHAGSLGVEVRRGFAAAGVLEDSAGRIVGVRGSDGEELRAEFVADCSGQAGFLSRFRKIRLYNQDLENVACYAYFKGAPWKYRYNGHPDKTKIFVCSVGEGWLWYIPIAKDTVSVGLVCARKTLTESGQAPEEFFRSRLRRCREIWPLLAKAEVIEDFDGAGKGFFVQSDWSYLNVKAAGPGWLAAGDAAVFVDPILSTGVTLAHLAAHRAAYTLLTGWSEREPSYQRRLWRDYNLFCRESAEQFLALALFWYGRDRDAARWWRQARELCRSWLPAGGSDHAAFITVSAGLTRHYERLLTAATLAQADPARPEDFPFLVSVLGGAARRKPGAGGLSDRSRPRLAFPYKTELAFVPSDREPRLVAARRVRFLKRAPSRPLAGAFNPRRIVTRYHLELLRRLDGRTFGEARAEAGRAGVPDWWLRRPAEAFVEDLRVHGVLSNRL